MMLKILKFDHFSPISALKNRRVSKADFREAHIFERIQFF